MKEIIEKLQYVMNIMGIDISNYTKVHKRVLFTATILIIFLLDTILLLKYKWDDINLKMNAFRNIASVYIVGMYTLIYAVFTKDFCLQIQVIEEGIIDYQFSLSEARQRLLDKIKKDMIRQNNTMYYALMTYVIITNLIPLLGTVFKYLTANDIHISNENLPLSFPFYFPEAYRDNIIYYIVIYIYEMILLIAYVMTGYVCYSSSLHSMQIIENELRLLCMSVKELDDCVGIGNRDLNLSGKVFFSSSESDDQTDLKNSNNKFHIKDFMEYNNKLRQYMTYIVHFHQSISRKANKVNKGVEGVTFVLNSGVTVYVCTSLYFIVQNNGNAMFVLQEGVVCMVTAMVLCFFCFNGEKIITESDNLSHALYECSWIDKPLWFKKTLLIMLLRNSKGVEIKPFGLFVLNLRNFLLTMNAAYSYYNLINNFSKK